MTKPLRTSDDGDAARSFEPHRRRLVGLAYRMLGSVTDAEDAVQDAYLRWHATERFRIENPGAFLSKTVTQLCLDHLKSARVRRETYVGSWLPEPLIEDDTGETLADDISVALLLALERLSPLERAAFLLHDVFEMEFAEVADALGRNEAACRQLASRARQHVRAERPRFEVPREEGNRIAEAFFEAARSGDAGALRQLLAEDVTLYTDGGGRRIAALNPILGLAKVTKFFAGLARKGACAGRTVVHRGPINGLPGQVTVEADGNLQTTALEIRDRRIAAIYVVRNPDKLMHLDPQRLAGHSRRSH